MSFVPKKIVNEEVEILSECHVNKGAGLSNGLCLMYDDDTVDVGINCLFSSSAEDEASKPLHSFDKNLFDLCKVPADQIAAQITLIDVQLFKAIKGHEFTNCAWSKKDKSQKAPNIVAFTRRFNQVCFWVEREILNEESVRLRAEVVTHFIKIAKKLLELNNLHSLMAIISGLQSAPIHRLSMTWKFVAKKDKTSLDKLLELMSQEENCKLLREHLNGLHLPCIPYLGMYLTDLTFLDLGRKKNGSLSTPTTPVSKFADYNKRTSPITNIQAQIDAIHNTIGYFQNSTYVGILHEQPHIMEYLKSFQYIEELEKLLEDNNYKRSLEIEPIEKGGKSRTLEHHHSFSNPIRPMISLLRSKSDEDLLHSASPLLSEHRATKKRGSLHGTSSSTTMVQELKNRLSKIHPDDEDEPITDAEGYPEDQCTDTLSPVIKVTSCSPVAQRKQCRSSSEDITATATTNVPPKAVTPIIKKRFIPKHRKARSLGSNVLASLGIQVSSKSKSADTPPSVHVPKLSLLDDSVISSPPYYMPGPGSVASSSSSSLVSLDTDEEFTRSSEGEDFTVPCELTETSTPIREGILKRRIIKKYGKSKLSRKEKLWVQLIGCALLMWPLKQWVKNKKKLKEGPVKKGLSLHEFRVIYQDPAHSYKLSDHQFIISDDKNTVIKFSAPGGGPDASDWVTRIRSVIWTESRRAEEFETNHSLIKL